MDDDTEDNDISLIKLLLAHKLEMSQEELAQTEQVLDLYIATLSRYITDTGAKLEISAIFPDKTIQFENVPTFLTAILAKVLNNNAPLKNILKAILSEPTVTFHKKLKVTVAKKKSGYPFGEI